jgi:hypothetical protein
MDNAQKVNNYIKISQTFMSYLLLTLSLIINDMKIFSKKGSNVNAARAKLCLAQTSRRN